MSNAADIVSATIGGRTFRCSKRTEAHLLWTVDRLAEDHPGSALIVIQGSYNTGVAASAGTHDYDAVFDVAITGLDWRLAQRWLREHGWAAFYRYPPTFSEHIHMVSLGYPGQVGVYVPGQVRDYHAGRNGLAGHAPDPSWRPGDIDATVFDYDAWLEEQDMAQHADQLNRIEAAALAAVTAAQQTKARVDKMGTNLKADRAGDKALAKALREIGADVDKVLARVAELDDESA